MKKDLSFWIAFLASLAMATGPVPAAQKKVLAPKKIFYDGKDLSYNPAWQDKEIYLESDLDDDPEPEVIIGFIATYEPRSGDEEDREKAPSFLPVPAQKKILPIQNYAFYQIYDLGPDGRFHLTKTYSGMDQLGTVELVRLDTAGPSAVAILNPGGEHYLDLSIYQWRDGGYRLLFNETSSDGIELETDKNPVALRIGRPCREETDRSPCGETFIWNEAKKNFERST